MTMLNRDSIVLEYVEDGIIHLERTGAFVRPVSDMSGTYNVHVVFCLTLCLHGGFPGHGVLPCAGSLALAWIR